MNKKMIIFLLCAATSLSTDLFGEDKKIEAPPRKKRRSRRLRRRERNAQKIAVREKQSLDKNSSNSLEINKKEESAKIIKFTNPTAPLEIPLKAIETKKDKELSLLLADIEFTHSGIQTFFTQTFNRKEYGKEFLPHNFSHLTQFLRYGTQLSQPPEFFEGVMRLFHQKLKSSPFVNAHALETMLVDATDYLEQQFPKEEKQSFWKSIKKLLWTNFKDNFSFLRSNPMGFFEDISDEIIQKVRIHVSSPDKLRASILRFTEGNVDKIVWSPYDQLETWKSCKRIGDALNQLYEKNIITDPYDANDLYWGLVERYCYFLELTGTLLSKETIFAIHKDITENKVAWLEMEEQEEGLETKKERLIQALLETQAKIQFSEIKPIIS